jgi:tetratricopeptide (TPR) repeat protein
LTLEVGQAAGQPDTSAFFRAQQFYIRFEQGRLDEFVAALEAVVAQTPGIPAFEAVLAVAYAELDRNDKARAILERWASFDSARRPTGTTWLRSLTSLAMVAAHLRDKVRATALYDLLIPCAGHVDAMAGLCAGAFTHYLGLLAATLELYEKAEEHFAAAAATHVAIGAPTWLARTRLESARMLLDRRGEGDAERAHDLLGQAVATARDLGLSNVERRAVALLNEVSRR